MRRSMRTALAGLAISAALPMMASATPVLYGVSLNGHTSGSPGSSSLYSIDTTTGAGTVIGSIGYAVNSLAADPTTGKLYASTTTWSGAFNGLLEIDTATGAGSEIGSFGASFTSILGLSFNSTGALFGWHDPGADDPVTIDKTTGAATTIGDAGVGTAGQVLAFDNADTLLLMQGFDIYSINTLSGSASFVSSLGFDPGAGGGDIDNSTGLLWASQTFGSESDSIIRVTDLGAGTFTDIDTDVSYLNALAFGAAAVVSVPEPTSLALLGLALMGLSARRRRAD